VSLLVLVGDTEEANKAHTEDNYLLLPLLYPWYRECDWRLNKCHHSCERGVNLEHFYATNLITLAGALPDY